jgi:hypothetical protein
LDDPYLAHIRALDRCRAAGRVFAGSARVLTQSASRSARAATTAGSPSKLVGIALEITRRESLAVGLSLPPPPHLTEKLERLPLVRIVHPLLDLRDPEVDRVNDQADALQPLFLHLERVST